MAKLLYLALRIRPNVPVAVSFFAARVINPTVYDRDKLDHVLKYLNGTRDLQYVPDTSPIDRVFAYIDSSHACHTDVIGHSGFVLVVGCSTIHF